MIIKGVLFYIIKIKFKGFIKRLYLFYIRDIKMNVIFKLKITNYYINSKIKY